MRHLYTHHGKIIAVLQINSQNDVLRIVDSLPPSYDSVVKCDLPPPPYDCVVIDVEQHKDMQPQTSAKDERLSQAAAGAISVAMPGATLHIWSGLVEGCTVLDGEGKGRADATTKEE